MAATKQTRAVCNRVQHVGDESCIDVRSRRQGCLAADLAGALQSHHDRPTRTLNTIKRWEAKRYSNENVFRPIP